MTALCPSLVFEWFSILRLSTKIGTASLMPLFLIGEVLLCLSSQYVFYTVSKFKFYI